MKIDKIKNKKIIILIEKDEDGIFVGSVSGIVGCHAQGSTIKEMFKDLEEVFNLCYRNLKYV